MEKVCSGAWRFVAQCHPNTLEYLGIRCFLGVKKPGHEADHSAQFSAGDKERMELTSIHFHGIVTI